MEYKEYEKLNFNSLYKGKKYPKNLWPVLNEYFSRYKSEFGLSNDEINQKLRIVLANLDVIQKDGSIKDRWNGVFIPAEKKIKINVENINFQKLPQEQILNTIFHELNHAGENAGVFISSFQSYNSNTNKCEGVALNEVITEMKSSRLACNDRTELLSKSGDERETLQLTGYGDLIFIGTMIHTALGIGEKEFLKLADKGKVEFDRQMREKFPPGDDSYDNFMNTVTYYSDMLHAIKYNGSRNFSEQDKENMKLSVDGIRDNCMYIMGKRMTYEAFKNKESIDLSELTTKCRFELEKLDINYKKGMKFILPDNEIDKKSIYKDDLKKQIMEYETLDKNKNKLSYSDLSELLYASSEGEFIYNRMQSEFGIYSQNDLNDFDKTMDLEYETQLLKKEYGESSWNNDEIMGAVNKFSKSNIFLKLAKDYVNGYKVIIDAFKSLYDDYKAARTWGKLPAAKEELNEKPVELIQEEKNEKSLLKDLNDMVKSEEEIYNDQPIDEKNHEIKEQEWFR